MLISCASPTSLKRTARWYVPHESLSGRGAAQVDRKSSSLRAPSLHECVPIRDGRMVCLIVERWCRLRILRGASTENIHPSAIDVGKDRNTIYGVSNLMNTVCSVIGCQPISMVLGSSPVGKEFSMASQKRCFSSRKPARRCWWSLGLSTSTLLSACGDFYMAMKTLTDVRRHAPPR